MGDDSVKTASEALPSSELRLTEAWMSQFRHPQTVLQREHPNGGHTVRLGCLQLKAAASLLDNHDAGAPRG